MTLSFDANQLRILRGDRKTGQLQKYAPSMANDIASSNVQLPKELCMVTADSPVSYKDAVETLGACWLQELQFDMRPFTTWEYRKRDSEGRHFHFRHTPTTDDVARSFFWYFGKLGHWQTCGGCTFRRRKDAFGSYWGLQWIWIHPNERRKGLLTSTWPFFRSMFGVFLPEPPLSRGLISCVKKMNYVTVLDEFRQERKGYRKLEP